MPYAMEVARFEIKIDSAPCLIFCDTLGEVSINANKYVAKVTELDTNVWCYYKLGFWYADKACKTRIGRPFLM